MPVPAPPAARLPRAALCAAALALPLALAGCGGGGEDGAVEVDQAEATQQADSYSAEYAEQYGKGGQRP